jgi:membrane protease YdiL (CAAX protease family)
MTKRTSARLTILEPYLLFLIFVGIGLGTVMLTLPVRLALLWSTLALLSLLYRGRYAVEVGFSLPNVGRGALLGLVIALPVLAFLAGPLRAFMVRLYGTEDIVLLFYLVCFVSAPVEEFFFRGVIQDAKGSSVSTGLYAATALLLFLPHTPLLVAFIMFVALGVLGIVYGYVREHYGLMAAIACHVVVGFILQIVPLLIERARMLLA